MKTLSYLSKLNTNLRVCKVSSGTAAFDWEVPQEWHFDEAYIADMSGNKIVSTENSNLHIVGYSTPVNTVLSKDELQR